MIILKQTPIAGRCAISCCFVPLCIGLRLAILPVDAGLAFLTFYPGIAISALLCGLAPTALFIVIAGVSGGYIFVPPYWSFDQNSYVPITAFMTAGSSILLVIHFYQQRMAAKTGELQQEIAAHARLEAIFQQTFDLAPVGIAHISLSGQWRRLNRKLSEILGYSHDELLQKTFQEITPADDLTADMVHYYALLSGEKDFCSIDKRYIKKDGSTVWVNVTVSLVRDEQGKPDYFIAVIKDITERRATLAALEKAREAAEIANVAKTAFMSNMSHEMRTPLHQITALAQLARKDAQTEKQVDRIEKLNRAAKRLHGIIEAILTLTELESSNFKLSHDPVDLAEVLRVALQQVEDKALEKELQMEVKTLPALPEKLYGDPKHIQMALMCYISNAITFTDAGKISTSVEIAEATSCGVLLRFTVTDTGIGIAPDVQPRLFSLFEQADNSMTRRYGGTGIGLATVAKLAKLMGGAAGCSSEPGKGSSFWFTVYLNK
jgi:PAS domain S-box-containing protein